MSDSALKPKMFFSPVHPLNMPRLELLAEERSPSNNWPAVERVSQFYEDVDGWLRLRVCFGNPQDPGNIDNVRCYDYALGKRREISDPAGSLGPISAAADACEKQMKGILSELHGIPAE
jgi:hypothetical protein